MFRNHLSSHRRVAQQEVTTNLLPATVAPTVDDTPEITALERAILEGKEQLWDVYGVPEEERARQRPGIAQFAKHVCDGLRAEHAARTKP